MEEKIETYEETKRYINMAIEELAVNKDTTSLEIYSALIDILDVIQEKLDDMQDIVDYENSKDREYQELEQNRIYREMQGF